MSVLRSLRLGQQRDLIVLFLVALVAHPLIPVGHWLARDDLLPWTTALVAAVAWLRGASLGAGPVRPLVQRSGGWLARVAYRILGPLTTIVIAVWFDTSSTANLGAVWLVGVVTAALVVVVLLAREHRQTAWDPAGPADAVVWVGRGVVLLGGAFALGLGYNALTLVGDMLGWLPFGVLVGLQYYAIGLAYDSPRAERQRGSAAQQERISRVLPRFRYLLAVLGPAASVSILTLGHTLYQGSSGYADGMSVAVLIVAWAYVLWPSPYPVAMHCVLHEVVPSGGRDAGGQVTAASFAEAPVGALRLNPRAVRRLRAIHPWVVPVQDPRLETLDDPVRPLWAPDPPFQAYHILGDARFEPAAGTKQPQWDVLTLRISDVTDVGRLADGNLQQRRLVVLRPFPMSGWRSALRRSIDRTYRWQGRVASELVQHVDATTERLMLRDGDVLVLSTEGVARAYELEVGAPVYSFDEFGGQRPPQLEDYVKAP